MSGGPGTGKSALLLEAAIRMSALCIHVAIARPTGELVFVSKSQLPDSDGIDNVCVHALQGIWIVGCDMKRVK